MLGKSTRVFELNRSGWVSRELEMSLAPEDINYRVKEQFQNTGGDDAADHGSGDAFHDIGSALVGWRPHDGEETEKNGADGHDLGADALNSAFDHRGLEIVHCFHATRGTKF